MNKLKVAALIAGACLFSNISHAAVISSYEAGLNIDISSQADYIEFETVLFDSFFDFSGSATGSTGGSGDSGVVFPATGDTNTLSASTFGQVTDAGDFIEGAWYMDGYFYAENNTGNDIDITIDISWFANIFTDSVDEDASAVASIIIEDGSLNTIVDDFISFDSFFEGVGEFGTGNPFSWQTITLTVADGDFEELFIYADVDGFAESFRAPLVVSEPGSLLLASLGFVLLFRRHTKRF